MAAEALIAENAYQRGYTDAMADMRKKKEQRRQREQEKKARRWYFIKQKACGLAMLAITVLAVWATEPLVIETPEAATEGSIRVYDYDGCCIYSYYGKIRINSDGKDGKEIDVEALGYLEGYQEHKDESGAGE